MFFGQLTARSDDVVDWVAERQGKDLAGEAWACCNLLGLPPYPLLYGLSAAVLLSPSACTHEIGIPVAVMSRHNAHAASALLLAGLLDESYRNVLCWNLVRGAASIFGLTHAAGHLVSSMQHVDL